jgi:UDP-glucose 4-epimerase
MKVLITGGKGFIGSHLMEKIPDAISYDLKDGEDIRNIGQLKNTIEKNGITDIIHLAAQTSVAHAWDNPTDYYSHNITGTSCVIEAAIKYGIKRIIYASSASVYGYMENPYAASKAVQEVLFKVRENSIYSVGFRFMNVYGKGQNPAYGTVIPAFIKGIQEGKIKIFGDGTQTRDFIHVDDVCKGIKLALDREFNPRFYRNINMDLGTGKAYSVKEVAFLLMGILGKKAEIEYTPPRKEMQHSVANLATIKRIYEFEPEVSFIKGLERLVEGL